MVATTTKPELTERQKYALAYVIDHPGCTSGEIGRGIGLESQKAKLTVDALYARRLIGRQPVLRFEGSIKSLYTYWPES